MVQASEVTDDGLTKHVPVLGWLPGEHAVSSALPLDGDLSPGTYELAVAVVDPNTEQPAMRLAVEGRAEDGWYPVSKLEVTE